MGAPRVSLGNLRNRNRKVSEPLRNAAQKLWTLSVVPDPNSSTLQREEGQAAAGIWLGLGSDFRGWLPRLAPQLLQRGRRGRSCRHLYRRRRHGYQRAFWSRHLAPRPSTRHLSKCRRSSVERLRLLRRIASWRSSKRLRRPLHRLLHRLLHQPRHPRPIPGEVRAHIRMPRRCMPHACALLLRRCQLLV